VDLERVWQECIKHRRDMEELGKVSGEMQKVFEEMGDFAKGLRQKREKAMEGVAQLRKEVDDFQHQLAQELCHNARYPPSLRAHQGVRLGDDYLYWLGVITMERNQPA
jgi:hypothetical protein